MAVREASEWAQLVARNRKGRRSGHHDILAHRVILKVIRQEIAGVITGMHSRANAQATRLTCSLHRRWPMSDIAIR